MVAPDPRVAIAGEAAPAHRVVITGAGIVSPLGRSPDGLWRAIEERRSGVGSITRFDASAFPVRIAAEVPDADAPDERFDEAYWRALDRRSRFAVAAALSAVQHAGLVITPSNRDAVAVAMASERPEEEMLLEGARLIDDGRVTDAAVALAAHARPHAPAERVAALVGSTGPVLQIENRSAGGLLAIMNAASLIREGTALVALAGGAEAPITPLMVAAFSGTGALSRRNDEPERASRPLDRDRDGFVLAEGAAVVVLEALEVACARGAHVLAELEGWGATFSPGAGGHPAQSAEQGGAALQRALATAGRVQSEVDVLALHAAGTVEGDRLEAFGVKRIFGAATRHHLYTPALKSQLGHALGASGPLSMVALLEALARQRVPGTINLEHEDPECDLDANPGGVRADTVRVVVANATGWAHNAALVLAHPEAMRAD